VILYETLSHDLKELLPEKMIDFDFDSELKSILDDWEKDTTVIARPTFHQLIPGEKGKMSKSYFINTKGKFSAILVNNVIATYLILDERGKDIALLDKMLGDINVNNKFYIDGDLDDIISELYRRDGKSERQRVYDGRSRIRLKLFLTVNNFIKLLDDEKRFKFNKRGKQLINCGSYNKFIDWEIEERAKASQRQELSDKLLTSSIDATTIQSRLLVANGWIALAGIVAAVYYVLEIVRLHYPPGLYLSIVLLIFLSGACLGAALWYILPLIEKVIKKWLE